jgi:hypothetical protein
MLLPLVIASLSIAVTEGGGRSGESQSNKTCYVGRNMLFVHIK